MKKEVVDTALANARIGATSEGAYVDELDRCMVARIVHTFLSSLKKSSPWYARIFLGLVLSRVEEWQVDHRCS